MTDDEWEAICTTLEECFAGDFPQRTRDNYRLFLRRFSATDLLGGIAALVEQGRKFLPKPGELVVEIRKAQDPPVPCWDEVWVMLQAAMRASGANRDDAEGAGIEWLQANGHPVVARFYELETYENLRMVPFWDPDYGHFRIADLRSRWEEFIGAAEQRVVRQRALATLGVSDVLEGCGLADVAIASPPRQIQA